MKNDWCAVGGSSFWGWEETRVCWTNGCETTKLDKKVNMQQQLSLCVPIKSQLIIFSSICSPSFLSISFFLSKLLLSTEQTLAYAIYHSYHNWSRSGRTCTFQHILHYRFKCRRSHWTSQVIYCKRFSLHTYLLVVSILELLCQHSFLGPCNQNAWFAHCTKKETCFTW